MLGGVVQGLVWRVVEASKALELLQDHLVESGQPLDVVCVIGFVGSEVSVGLALLLGLFEERCVEVLLRCQVRPSLLCWRCLDGWLMVSLIWPTASPSGRLG